MNNSKTILQDQLTQRLLHFFGVTPEEASREQLYQGLALIARDKMREERRRFEKEGETQGAKKVYYLCMEFLMGRSLKNTLYNLNMTEDAAFVLREMGESLESLYECEPDAGLGNGGLGRLAACYLDALATQGYPAMGHSILYDYGIFKQKLVDGWQTEMPDFWLPGGEVWLVPRDEIAVDICFEGTVHDEWQDGYHLVELRECSKVKAVPYDMFVAGKDGKGVSVLRLWSATADGIDMTMFNQGDYLRAMEQKAMAEVISKVLYPADNHPEGKSLRLRQQYFLVSASIQDIVRLHLRKHKTLDNLPEKVAIHINDTHPTLGIPELMRLLLDECGYNWDDAWQIVTRCFAYTNHTVMKEALECWPEELLQRLLPRVYQILKEIDNRLRAEVWARTGNAALVEQLAVLADGVVRMANLCVWACHSVNGVSALHSEILKDDVFHEFYRLMPDKFCNVTNGIAHRRWLCQANPRLTTLLRESIGDEFITNAAALEKLRDFAGDSAMLEKLAAIKRANKVDFAARVKKRSGITLNPDSIFDVQVKRLHEYKRQHLNALHIVSHYLAIKENPNGDYTPHTYLFAAKAAPSYFIAKKVIAFICALADLVNNDPDMRGRLNVVFLENYNVTLAEALMPTADISEQISLAGTEASGTGNMKLMMNGAVTLGTMDGANIEIREAVGDDNILIFGMNEKEVTELRRAGYDPGSYYQNNVLIADAIDFINRGGLGGKDFSEIFRAIMHHDPYMVLADFADYHQIHKKAFTLYPQTALWTRMSLHNIAGAGRFAADRAVEEYATNIWGADAVK